MKKSIIALFLSSIFLLATSSCTSSPTEEEERNMRIESLDPIISMELEGCFNYFWEQTNVTDGSPGYGVTKDSTKEDSVNYGSIAATGYALVAYALGAEYGFADYDEAEKRAKLTLKTFYETAEDVNGFYYHFIKLSDAQRFGNVEISGIDTALFLSGALVAAEYFGGETKEYFDKIYERVNWQWLRRDSNNRFYMAYDENGSGKFSAGDWDVYAEQFIMYILGAGSPTYPVDGSMFYSFDRWNATYGDYNYIRSWSNSIFVYQYSHGFIDFRDTVDQKGVDWFENSVNATYAARQYCIDVADTSKTYGENSWGLSACINKGGYEGLYGAEPNGMPGGSIVTVNDGTIPIYGAAASIVFTPELATSAMNYYYDNFPKLWGKYGFTDSYNLDIDYFCPYFLGIDKGDTMVMIANYIDGFVWKYFMSNENVQRGMEACGITKK